MHRFIGLRGWWCKLGIFSIVQLSKHLWYCTGLASCILGWTPILSSKMPWDISPNKTVVIHVMHSHTKFTEDPLKILIHRFNEKPYLVYASKQKFAWKETLKSLESKFGFRIKEVDTHSREDQNLQRPQNQTKAMDKITLKR